MCSNKLNKLIIIGIFSVMISGCINAQNIALNKSYTLSDPPNYSLSAPSSDKSSLTDGIYTVGYFWARPTTAGWQNFSKITIDIDLEKQQPVGEVTFNTARRMQAGVSFPANIYVFLSKDNQHFIYAGDAAASTDNQPGDYEVKKFVLNKINQLARYVLIIVIPKGVYVFCDEIEVIKGTNNSNLQSKLILKDSLNNTVDSLKTIEFNRNHLLKVINRLQNKAPDKFEKNLAGINGKLNDVTISKNKLKEIKSQVEQTHASMLRNNYKMAFLLEKYNPWDTLNEIHEPKENTDRLNYQFLIPDNGVQYGAFVLTNTQVSAQKFVVNTSNSNSNNSIEIFKATYVAAADFAKIPDALIPLKNNTIIEPGISELFLFKITGEKSGIINSTITIRSTNKTAYVNISGKVLNFFAVNNKDKLNAISWAYLSCPMLQGRETEAAKDLQQHHINTIDVPPAFIPKMDNNYQPFLNYLAYFKNIKNILLLVNYSDKENYKQFGSWMSPEFKNNFIKWYYKLMEVLQESEFSSSQIYLYPYDEVNGDDMDEFKKFASWAKKAIPGIKIYATLTNKDAINNILPLVDIAQIPSNLNLLPILPAHHCEIWIYATESSSRSLSPYLYYRLMAWNAFVNDITGIGFWDYADEGRDKQLNLISDSWINSSNSYSVIYNGPGKEIISSRRWEAFRLGIEDYSILKLYSKKYGNEKTKFMANEVLANPKDLNKADIITHQMLNEL